MGRAATSLLPQPAWRDPAAPHGHDLIDEDRRFRNLVGERSWAQLPERVRHRFSKVIRPGATVVYRGVVTETRLSRLGLVLARLARVIGAPLPLRDGSVGAAVVVVTPDRDGQHWMRTYACAGSRPQIIRSTKCFSGPTGLEEHVGYGIGMALVVGVEDGALRFRSDHYFLQVGGVRLRLPEILEPGRMQIVHREEEGGTFSFCLSLDHPRFGRLLHQQAFFADTGE